MLNLVYIYIYQIYYDYISHQSCISHLNDKPIYIYIYIYSFIYITNWNVCWGLHLLHLFKGVAAAAAAAAGCCGCDGWVEALWGLKYIYIYMYVCVCMCGWPDKIVYIYIYIYIWGDPDNILYIYYILPYNNYLPMIKTSQYIWYIYIYIFRYLDG